MNNQEDKLQVEDLLVQMQDLLAESEAAVHHNRQKVEQLRKQYKLLQQMQQTLQKKVEAQMSVGQETIPEVTPGTSPEKIHKVSADISAEAATETTKDAPVESQTEPQTESEQLSREQRSPEQRSPEQRAEHKKQKNREANRAAVKLLCDTYPRVFSLTKPRPLKVGIQQELAEDGKISNTKIKRGLAGYVRQYAYLRSQTEGAARINIQGVVDGEVNAGDAAHALGKLPPPNPGRKPRGKHAYEGDKHKNERKEGDKNQGNKSRSKSGIKAKKQIGQKPHAKGATKHGRPAGAQIQKAENPFHGLDDSQRMISKLDILLNKHR